MDTGIGAHSYRDDPRNAEILVSINGRLVPRSRATVSVFDSGFVLGDGVWEGLRLQDGHLVFFDAHMDRLYEGAKAIDLDIGLTRAEMHDQILACCDANGMSVPGAGAVHIRLMVTRGVKRTPYQDPRVTIGGPTIVIIPEYKAPSTAVAEAGLSLFTVHVRRGAADVQDPKWNSHSKLNCISACIQAAKAGADEALMLDPHGFVATCNSTHFFIVRKGEVWTSTGDYCLLGVTRQAVIDLCRAHGVPVHEKNFSLTQVYSADEAFVTGTFAGLTPVRAVDGRTLGPVPAHHWQVGPMVRRLQALYADLIGRTTPGAERPAPAPVR